MGMEMWFRKKENAPSLLLKGFYRVLTDLNISATLPPEFSKFRHLKLLDLSRNYFTGSIPQEWATTKLEVLSFMGNRLSGPFPKVFTYITSLRNLSIEGNNFSGPIPPDVGKLINLQRNSFCHQMRSMENCHQNLPS
ncbi:Leucine-rich repeat - like 3 [Theobroma cacao]|nr:Leucine-rich repeat - like 3 [Theobroma cacao]